MEAPLADSGGDSDLADYETKWLHSMLPPPLLYLPPYGGRAVCLARLSYKYVLLCKFKETREIWLWSEIAYELVPDTFSTNARWSYRAV